MSSTPPWANVNSNTSSTQHDDETMVNPYSNTNEETTDKKDNKLGIATGAAIAGGIVGTVVLGPLVGLVGAAAAGVMTLQNNQAGDIARGTGSAVVSAGEKAKDFSDEHQLVEKTQSASNQVVQQAQQADEQYGIVGGTKKSCK